MAIKKHRGLLLAVIIGAIFGLLTSHGVSLAESNRAPDGWTKGEASVPFRRADLMGNLPESSTAWSLDHFQAISGETPTDQFSLTITLPEGGEARIFPSAVTPRQHRRQNDLHSTVAKIEPNGAAIILRRSLGGSADASLIVGQNELELGCSGSLPTPTDNPYTISTVVTPGGFTATSGGETLSCQADDMSNPPAIQAGLHRVHISEIVTANGSQSAPGSLFVICLLTLLGGILGGLALLLERRSGAHKTICLLTSHPLLLAWPLSEMNGLALIEQLRAPLMSPYSFFITGPLTITIFLKVIHHSVRLSRGNQLLSRKSIAGILLLPVLAIFWAIAVGVSHPGVFAYTALFGLALGGLVWVNTNNKRVRYFNGVSVVLFTLSMIFTETALRFSETGTSWSPRGQMSFDESLGWTRSTLSDFEALDRGEHTDYPSEGYPIGFEETDKRRVVCLGSSATGGAFQNDDLDDFYPARLSELLGGELDVINQGVGGWTTFHMAHYFESKASELSPDIVTVYAGHNDLLTKSAAPYRDLYSAWSPGGDVAGPSPLDSLLLYQGLRFVVGAIISPEGAIAVPLAHAKDNLVRIIEAAEEQDSDVILMTEAISPDSGPMEGYSRMMIDLANSYENTSYVEIPAVVLARGSSMFLDDVHLTDAGHRTVAGEIANHITGSTDSLR